ncbi:ZapG family protein [Salinimonas chungwhensis]|uniref:ZapG family protein n=1 Tax=Salinimonas chungwhensis TaxID=265425 RepID=UPI00035CAA27|nr:DUF1043 family protein [Salinimonas chungwhensis]
MEVLIPLALLVVGLIIGFFVARYVYTRDGSDKSVKQAEKNVKEIMGQQAEHHFHQTRQIVDSLENQCQSLRMQLEEYEGLLKNESDDDSVPFYGEQASAYLRNNLHGREKSKVKTVSGSSQPRDFAGASSGLFVGTESSSSAPEKEK